MYKNQTVGIWNVYNMTLVLSRRQMQTFCVNNPDWNFEFISDNNVLEYVSAEMLPMAYWTWKTAANKKETWPGIIVCVCVFLPLFGYLFGCLVFRGVNVGKYSKLFRAAYSISDFDFHEKVPPKLQNVQGLSKGFQIPWGLSLLKLCWYLLERTFVRPYEIEMG